MKRRYQLDIRLYRRSPPPHHDRSWWISEIDKNGIEGYLFDCLADSDKIRDRLLRPLMGTHLLDHLELR